MSLPIYHHINVRSAQLDDIQSILVPELNLRRPVVFNLKTLKFYSQLEVIGLIENYFVSNNLSYKFPYAVYFLTDHEATVTKMPSVKIQEELPRFFSQKETKMNVRETHVIGKNKLLQMEVKNSDAELTQQQLQKYADLHRTIRDNETERFFYRSILDNLNK